ncbi:TRAP transporter small permease [Algihabitans albus]|uniref:TRAP transporter small permease n=1 Tax=Algihabitans albus TaxID=2164067 RepID=UPI000E5D6B6A|nr:TRAP transporter small permease [Algihabitans albus]
MRATIDKASALAAQTTGWLVVGMASVMLGSLILQVLFRYLLGQALIWSEELALFLFTWVVLLTGSLGVREGFHVRLTFLLDLLPSAPRAAIEKLLITAVLVFGALLAYSGASYVDATLGQVSAAVRYPIETLHLAAPVSGVLIVLHALALLLGPSPQTAAGNDRE